MLRKLKLRLSKFLVKHHRYIAPLLPAGFRPYTFLGGKIFLNLQESSMMLRRIFHQYEIQIRRVLEQELTEGKVFVDIGACLGDFSLIAATLVGESGKVLAFEPDPDNCLWLRKSIALNNYNNIILHEMALGESHGSAQLYLSDKSGWNTLIADQEVSNSAVITVLKRTLDEVLEEHGIQTVDLIKIDVEGSELNVLKGALNTIRANLTLIILVEVHPHLGVEVSSVEEFFRTAGFEFKPVGIAHANQYRAERISK